MHKNEKWIREQIRNRWLLGKDPFGNIIGVYSTSDIGAEYAFFKNQINPKPGVGNVDLTLTGALGRGIEIRGFNDDYEVISIDEKFDKISDKYGDYNFNITEDEKKELFNRILNVILIESINEAYELF